MKRTMTALMVWLAVLFTPSLADARWIRLTSEHFVFIGDAPEGTIRNIAQRLELFQDVIGRIFSTQATASPVPTVVVIFQNDRSLAPFRPVFKGKPVDAAGYFAQGDDVNYFAINAEQDTEAHGVIFHEYAHFLIHNAIGEVPTWADEGLAEFYETFTSSSARSAMVGMPNRYNLRLLQENTLLPVSQLIAVTHDSPMYNEGSRRGVFYAQSWALVHYFTFGGPERANRLRLFLTAVGQGEDGGAAFTQLFGGTESLDRDLYSYVRRMGMNAVRVEFDERIVTRAASAAVVISDQEAAGYLGEMLALDKNTIEAASTYLRKAIDDGSDPARAVASLGRLEVRMGNMDSALPLLERAVSLAPDMAAAQRSYGRLLWRQAEQGGIEGPSLASRARAALARAHQLEPDNAATAASLARIELQNASGAERAVTLMQQVVKASPAREDYRYMLAEALVAKGDYAAATGYLGPLVGRARSPQVKEAARRLLGRLSTEMNARNATPDSLPDIAAPPSGAPPPQTPAPRRETAQSGIFKPTLRPVLAGETRVLGTFSSVECAQGAVILQIDTDNGVVRIAAARFEDIEFLTYRQDTPGSVPCGPQRPAFRVLATFRTDGAPVPGADTPNRSVAIELLPDGYVPR
jgi:Tfp pilus assembly protein PilF